MTITSTLPLSKEVYNKEKTVYTHSQMFQTMSVYDISILGVWQGNHGRFPNITCAMHSRPLSETHQLL